MRPLFSFRSTSSRFVTALVAVGLMASSCGLISGSSRQDIEVYIPIFETAEAQYSYAITERQKSELILRNKQKMDKLLNTREAVRQAYEAVVENFPEDRTATPMARLEIADMEAHLDVSKLEPTDIELRRAIRMFQQIREDYPEMEFVQAKSMYDEATCLRKLKDYGEAQKLYRIVMEDYARSEDEQVRALAQFAGQFYTKTYIKE